MKVTLDSLQSRVKRDIKKRKTEGESETQACPETVYRTEISGASSFPNVLFIYASSHGYLKNCFENVSATLNIACSLASLNDRELPFPEKLSCNEWVWPREGTDSFVLTGEGAPLRVKFRNRSAVKFPWVKKMRKTQSHHIT